MARSILPHLNVATVKRRYRSTSGGDGDGGGAGQHKTNITTTTTTTNLSITNAIQQSDREGSIVDGGDSNLYFIEPQQQLLLEAFDSDMGMDVRTQSDIDYGEYSSSDNTTATSTSTYHLLESLASVTTTTISSISHQVTQHTNESFRLLRGDHNVSTSMYAAANCEGECHPDMELNETWSLDACGDDGGDGDTLSSVYFITAVYLLYIPIFVFALLGNGTVCYIVQSTPRMRTVTNYFIANLAMGDILMSLFCVPSSFISTFILGYWPFGIALCHFVNYSQAVSVLVSAYTLVAISIDRYIAIMWPLRPRITKR